ncbi:MAG: DNA-binding response regulator [Paenibacillus sp.]|jgi:two-component system response regulator YesN|nr:DNA-binding response regulator [Paenibacillus sp.]
MLKVLIAEDEMLVRIGLKNSIPWESLGMEVIADVANGQAAWEVYQKDKPDLILTDIKMPVMDGMQLIRQIRESDHQTKIIILTVYEEFDLVHKSLQLGVSDYILKLKMSIENIVSVLQKIKQHIQTDRVPSSSQTHEAKVDSHHLKEQVVKDYLFYGRYTDEEFAGMVTKLKFRLHPERLILCVMTIDDFGQMEARFNDKHGNLIRFSLVNMIHEILGGYHCGEVIHEKDEKYILLFSFQDIWSEQKVFQKLHEVLSHIQSVIKTYLNASVTFGISSLYHGYSALKKMYRECVSALEQRYFLGYEKFVRCDAPGTESLQAITNMKFEKMLDDSKEATHERYYNEIETGIKKLAFGIRVTKEDVKLMFIRWIHWPTVNFNIYMDDISVIALDYAGRIYQSPTLDETILIFEQYLSEIRRCQEKKKYVSKEIAEAVKFIKGNYNQDISLQEVADHVQLSASYLSSLFKKDLQLSFVEYLNHYRIEMAKDMLVNTHLKSYEIAEQVGYKDDSYFSRIFKKMTSRRPHEFRKQWFVVNGEERRDEDDVSLL